MQEEAPVNPAKGQVPLEVMHVLERHVLECEGVDHQRGGEGFRVHNGDFLCEASPGLLWPLL